MEKKFTLKNLTILWLFIFLLASVFLSFSHFKSESNDSKYYTELVVRYKNADFNSVLTPKWGENYWGFDPKTYMRDQFPGQLLMGVALTHLGIPAEQSLHILGMLFQIFSFLILAAIASHFLFFEGPLFLLLSLLLSPLAFSYNIRANHELGIMFFSFLALYSGFKFHQSKIWALVVSLASMSLLLIKGPFFIFSPVLFTVGYFFSVDQRKNYLVLLSVLFLCGASVIITTLGFEYLFMKITGESFLKEFWRIQIEQRAMAKNHTHFFLIQKCLNFYYYFSHYLAYALPWSFILLVYVLIKKKIREFISFFKGPLSQLFFSDQ